MATTIQLQRQGVSHTVKGWFAPCEHGEGWYIEIVDYQHRAWLAHISYPNCGPCYGTKRGQTAWSNQHNFLESKDLEQTKKAIRVKASRLVGSLCEFAPQVEAYMAYTDSDYRVYPHLKDDVYLLTASYEPETDTIRHEPSNVCLIAFDGPVAARFDVDASAAKYRAEIERAYHDFTLSHNQRQGERYAKQRLAWLLSEYIREAHKDETPVVRHSPERAGALATA